MRHVQHKNITWIDFEDINKQDLEYLNEHFNIHPLALEELFIPSYQPHVVQYDNCLFFSIHLPLFDAENRTTFPGEIDIILTSDYLITSHKHTIYQIGNFFRQIEGSVAKRQEFLEQTTAHLLHHLLELLFRSCFPKLHHISRRIDAIETEVFNGNEKEMVFEISVLKRDILNFRRTLKPQRAILESLLQNHHPYIPETTKIYFQDLVGTNIRLWSLLESHKETIEALEATNNSLLSHKLNLTMKVLTIFSAIMLPMTVYSNILAMSADIPLGKDPNAFWIHVAIMGAISVFTILVFRLKRWL
jgi:magnesium transporter